MNNSNENNDAQLWQIAKKRAAFKRQCVSYILVNALLVAIWFLGFIKTGGSNSFSAHLANYRLGNWFGI
ncbi:MAG: hypothetical protein V9E96_06975 [Chitinophagaceae bacterium]